MPTRHNIRNVYRHQKFDSSKDNDELIKRLMKLTLKRTVCNSKLDKTGMIVVLQVQYQQESGANLKIDMAEWSISGKDIKINPASAIEIWYENVSVLSVRVYAGSQKQHQPIPICQIEFRWPGRCSLLIE